MKWIDVFIRQQTPHKLAYTFRILAGAQIVFYFLHFWQTFFTWDRKWSWRGEINHSFSEYPETWNKRFKFADTVSGNYRKLDLTFTFASFQEWLNIYTFGFLIIDALKFSVVVYVFWQLSKVFADKIDFTLLQSQAKKAFLPNADLMQGSFKGFSTEGVRRLRLAALPILLIPILDYISKYIFILYASTQSNYPSLHKYPSALIISEPAGWLPYLFTTIILLGISQIFQFGQQLKEETELTV
jgi:hypothetical protein